MADPTNPYGYNQPPQPPQQPIWPPPPTVQSTQEQVPYVPFFFRYNRVSGNISDFREGALGLYPERLEIVGKAQLRQEITAPILIVLALVSCLGAIIAEIIFRYALLNPAQTSIDNANITEIVLESRKNRAGIAFRAPNYNGTIKPFCLCFQLLPDTFQIFAAWANYVAPDRTHEGRLKSGTSTGVLVLAAVVVLAIVFIIIYLDSFPSASSR